MKAFLGAVMALALLLLVLRVQGRKPAQGDCVDEYCVTLHADSVDFNSAQKSCQDTGGHLMTVRSTRANSVVSELLTGSAGNFWIGLKYMRDSCSTEPTLDLKGYTWITGDAATNFTNWKSHERVCSPKCVSLSKEDSTWTERDCNQAVQGYLCEYTVTTKCTRLGSQVLYETPFGFASEDLQEIPSTSNATDQHLGMKYICLEGDWVQAPWNCEVYKGGCDHNCSKSDDASVCTCFPGYKLESNNVRCSRTRIDPCLRANCSHKCVAKGQSYVCECPNGYELLQDRKTCQRIDNCSSKKPCPEENSDCVSTPGGFKCQCKSGFRKEKDTCEDEDECFSGPCEHICNNTIGSYQCECSDGYRVSSEDKHKCTLYCPHSECPAVCDFNNPHQCDCPNGFILEEKSGIYICIDIDECDSLPCDQDCINTPGGYICTCDKGFHVTDSPTCGDTEGISTTPSIIPTSRSPPKEVDSYMSAGAILGIIVGIVIVILLIACVIHHQMKRCGKITTDKEHGKDMHALQQVTTEKHTKKQPVSNVH